MSSTTHQAAMLLSKGGRLTVQPVTTPTPGPEELLISVHAIALNPVDAYMRDMGALIASYPAILGLDIAGTVVATGSSISSSSPFQLGTRVLAAAPAFYMQGKVAYGGFQERVVVPFQYAAVIPDNISFTDAATLPMGVMVAWSGWYRVGLPYNTHFTPSDNKGLLVWGAASSMGMCAVQTAKAMGFTVYATASPKHGDLIKALGAKEVFDYKDSDVVPKIVAAAKARGDAINTAFHAIGDLKSCLDVLVSFGGGSVAHAPPLLPTAPSAEGVDVKFITAPDGTEARNTHMSFSFQEWLAPRLASGEFVPAPKARVIPGGLEGLNVGMDELKGGVSGEKLVVEL
ncbi:uncharacterized protein Z518_07698 [Rhinocladiella mackenziei CBS 650.93]|uniref:Enoyl reductase (ER) domain-containing protein n=1 Tax=Rhinocladiella mackenziei CBS 650.93 TaxID=1442369 RepID=A0A0D2IE92_9EURO|nr:uncharacterized protein Z518_07698 [Rhinocladiella mackenziei CBS 650.93]KIX04144.1 hypothetical protein Z518_07698 [Rhinocladiella mackenziei CBS 650.93]